MNNFSDTELVAISPGVHSTVQSPNSNQRWVSFLYSHDCGSVCEVVLIECGHWWASNVIISNQSLIVTNVTREQFEFGR